MTAENVNVAVAGATGAVGRQMLDCLASRNFPINNLRLLASVRSEGKTCQFKGEALKVETLTETSFEGIDIALFSAGGGTSERFAPCAAAAGAVVVDNSSAWRMDDDVPLVVPEVNSQAIAGYSKKGIIANPNCSTIQMVVALNPIHQQFGIKRLVIATYQAVSGTGQNAIEELTAQTRAVLDGKPVSKAVYPHQIAFNCLPQIDVFSDNGYSREELKMVNETRKILEDDSIGITATTVRVPVYYGHSEAVNIETRKPVSPEAVRDCLENAPGVRLVDDPKKGIYPMPIDAAGIDDTLVGRIRRDESIENGINLWIVADNIRKGAATNTVQIAEILAGKYL